jgi:hypothetical protein
VLPLILAACVETPTSPTVSVTALEKLAAKPTNLQLLPMVSPPALVSQTVRCTRLVTNGLIAAGVSIGTGANGAFTATTTGGAGASGSGSATTTDSSSATTTGGSNASGSGSSASSGGVSFWIDVLL